jgi:hypothetical protein
MWMRRHCIEGVVARFVPTEALCPTDYIHAEYDENISCFRQSSHAEAARARPYLLILFDDRNSSDFNMVEGKNRIASDTRNFQANALLCQCS